jgi:CO dehydrogenase/acetyl-CoA synthase epsilon subunit
MDDPLEARANFRVVFFLKLKSSTRMLSCILSRALEQVLLSMKVWSNVSELFIDRELCDLAHAIVSCLVEANYLSCVYELVL